VYRLMVLLLLLVLAACGTAPLRESWDDETYYTTEGVEPLSWQLDIYTPDGATQRASYTQASPGGIVEGFQWSVRGDGAPLQMRWQAVPSGVDIQPRDIVQLTVDGEPAFWGVVTRTWPDDETDVREYVALGGLELLRYRSHINPKRYPEQDVAAIARQVISAYKHPAITYDAALIPDLGDTISMPSVYRLELGQILDTLARTVSSKRVTWGVDAQGRAFFGVPQGSVQVGYETSDLHWQPEAGDEVVTRVDLVLATKDEPQITSRGYYYKVLGVWVPMNTADPPPVPVVVSAVAASDGDYGVQRVYAASGMIRDDICPTTATAVNMDNVGDAIDGDADTYASNSGAGTASVTLSGNADAARGLALLLSVPSDKQALVVMRYTILNVWELDRRMVARWVVRGTGEKQLVRVLGLPPGVPAGGMLTVDAIVRVDDLAAGGDFKLYDARWLSVDEQRATEYAQSLLKPPAQRPASIRWQRYQAPVAEATITGAPGGDLTHQVREWRYVWTPQRLETVAMLGEVADGDMTRAISRVAAVNQAAALSTARALTEAK